ncbi:MAG: hypothetical protein JWP87_6382 [Labilithrix sp.]|nr:hypothetical protein [Labilithrix sp.]
MRGFLQPSLRNNPTDTQQQFSKLSRHRRAHLAEAAQTTLVKASQWARGEAVTPQVADALEAQLKAYSTKAAKKTPAA